jgi:hypothetical protein
MLQDREIFEFWKRVLEKKGVFEDAVQKMTAEKNPPKKRKLAQTTRLCSMTTSFLGPLGSISTSLLVFSSFEVDFKVFYNYFTTSHNRTMGHEL